MVDKPNSLNRPGIWKRVDPSEPPNPTERRRSQALNTPSATLQPDEKAQLEQMLEKIDSMQNANAALRQVAEGIPTTSTERPEPQINLGDKISGAEERARSLVDQTGQVRQDAQHSLDGIDATNVSRVAPPEKPTHAYPQWVDDRKAPPIPLNEVHDQLFVNEMTPKGPQRVDYLSESGRLIDEAKSHIPRTPEESDDMYRRRIIAALAERVRHTGDYIEKEDPLHELTSPMEHQDTLLMALEAQEMMMDNRHMNGRIYPKRLIHEAEPERPVSEPVLKNVDDLEHYTSEEARKANEEAAERTRSAKPTASEEASPAAAPAGTTEPPHRPGGILSQREIDALLNALPPDEDPDAHPTTAPSPAAAGAPAASPRPAVTPPAAAPAPGSEATPDPAVATDTVAATRADAAAAANPADEMPEGGMDDVDVEPDRPEVAPPVDGGARDAEDMPAAPTRQGGPETGPQPEDQHPAEVPTTIAVGVAATNHMKENILQGIQHLRSTPEDATHNTGIWKVPVVGPILQALRHPIRNVWQNGMARNAFDQQAARFQSSLIDILKEQMGDRSIGVEVTQDMTDEALRHGKERYAQITGGRWYDKIKSGSYWWWKGQNLVSGLSSLVDNSDMHYAKVWFRDSGAKSLGEDTLLKQQTALGEKFAKKTAMQVRDSSGVINDHSRVAEENRTLLRGKDETRFKADLEPGKQSMVDRDLKKLIAEYVKNKKGHDEKAQQKLVSSVNKYVRETLQGYLPTDQQKLFNKDGKLPEIASNIVKIAEDVSNHWDEYQKPTENENEKKWDTVTFELYMGNADWEARGGKTEVGVFTDMVAERLSREKAGVGTHIAAGSMGTVKDLGVYALAYVGGMTAGTALGLTSKTIGGVAGVAGLAFFKETGFRIAGIGFKGQTVREQEQYSRENAIGRSNPTGARIRKEFDDWKVLVPRISAKDRALNLEIGARKLEQDSSADSAKELLLDIASIDARIKRTKMSGVKGEMVQNFFNYTEGHDVIEFTQLQSNLLDAKVKLATYLHAHKDQATDFFQKVGEPVTGDFYTHFNNALERYTAVAEAQLTYSSQDKKNIRKALSSRKNSVYFNSDKDFDEVLKAVDQNILKDKGEYIAAKKKALKWMSLHRGASRAIQVAAGSYVVYPLVAGIPWAAAKGVALEVYDAVKDGFQNHITEWNDVLKGKFHIQKDSNGTYTTGLNPLQRAVLEVKSYGEQTFGITENQKVNVDKQVIQIPSSIEVRTQGTDVFWINKANGDVENMTGVTLKDTGGGFTFVDRNGVPRTGLFGGAILAEMPDSNEAVLLQKEAPLKEVPVAGRMMKIPEGTEWIEDKKTGKLDLIVAGRPDVVLIDDAKFDSRGSMSYGGKHPMLQIPTEAVSRIPIPQNESIPGFETKVENVNTLSEWEKHVTEVRDRKWHSANQLNFYNIKADGKVELDISKITSLKGHSSGVYFTLEDKVGKGIFVPVDGSGKLLLDPNSTKIIPESNGLTIGQLTKMVVNQDAVKTFTAASEYTHRPDIFNLETNGKHPGYIEAAWKEKGTLHVGATITGTSHLPDTIQMTSSTPVNTVVERPPIINTNHTYTVNLHDAIKENQEYRLPVMTSVPIFRTLDIDQLIPTPLLFRTNIERSVGTHGGHAHGGAHGVHAHNGHAAHGEEHEKKEKHEKEGKENNEVAALADISEDEKKRIKEEYARFVARRVAEIDADLASLTDDQIQAKYHATRAQVESNKMEGIRKEYVSTLSEAKSSTIYTAVLNHLNPTKKANVTKVRTALGAKENKVKAAVKARFTAELAGKTDEEIETGGKKIIEEEFAKEGITGISPEEFLEFNKNLQDIQREMNPLMAAYNVQLKNALDSTDTEESDEESSTPAEDDESPSGDEEGTEGGDETDDEGAEAAATAQPGASEITTAAEDGVTGPPDQRKGTMEGGSEAETLPDGTLAPDRPKA